MSDLVLHLKTCYFSQIKDGTKAFEYRIVQPYRGFERQTITHPHFGPDPVQVFAIYAQAAV